MSIFTDFTEASKDCDFIIAYESDLLLSSDPQTAERFESIQPLEGLPARKYSLLANADYIQQVVEKVDIQQLYLYKTLGFGRDQDYLQIAADQVQANFMSQLSPVSLVITWCSFAAITVWLLQQFIRVWRYPSKDDAKMKVELHRVALKLHQL